MAQVVHSKSPKASDILGAAENLILSFVLFEARLGALAKVLRLSDGLLNYWKQAEIIRACGQAFDKILTFA